MDYSKFLKRPGTAMSMFMHDGKRFKFRKFIVRKNPTVITRNRTRNNIWEFGFFWNYVAAMRNIPVIQFCIHKSQSGSIILGLRMVNKRNQVKSIAPCADTLLALPPSDCIVAISYSAYNEDNGHANFLYYNSPTKTFEHFEPHGAGKSSEEVLANMKKHKFSNVWTAADEAKYDALYDKALKEYRFDEMARLGRMRQMDIARRATEHRGKLIETMFTYHDAYAHPEADEFLERRIKNIGGKYKTVKESCPVFGVQYGDENGMCQFWNYLVAEMKILNPQYGLKPIQEAFLKFLAAQKMTTDDYVLEYNAYLFDKQSDVIELANAIKWVPLKLLIQDHDLIRCVLRGDCGNKDSVLAPYFNTVAYVQKLIGPSPFGKPRVRVSAGMNISQQVIIAPTVLVTLHGISQQYTIDHLKGGSPDSFLSKFTTALLERVRKNVNSKDGAPRVAIRGADVTVELDEFSRVYSMDDLDKGLDKKFMKEYKKSLGGILNWLW